MKETQAVDAATPPFAVFLLFTGLTAISLVPVWHATLPPLADYPNHLARMYILTNLETSALLQRYYENVLSAQPNLAMDLIVPLLARVVPLEIAGKLFIALTFLSLAGGVLVLHRVLFRRWSPWPCLAFLFLYNRMFLWGFLGYLFTLGLALFGLAAWIALRDRPAWRRLAVASAFAVCLYLGHLYAFGVYAVALAGLELVRAIEARKGLRTFGLADLAILGSQFLIPLYLFFFVSPTARAVESVKAASFWRKLEGPFTVVNTYHLAFDMLTLALVGGLVAFGLLTRRVVVAWSMSGVLLLLLLAYLAMPDRLFTSYFADQRLPIALALAIIASTDGRFRATLWRRGLALALVALFVVRMGLIFEVWNESNQVYAQYFEALDRLPRGSRLLPVIVQPGTVYLPPIPEFHVATLAVIKRQTFVPSLFAYPLHAAEAVGFAPAYRELAAETPEAVVRKDVLEDLEDPAFARTKGPFRPDLLAQYDYLLVAHEAALPMAVPAALETVFVGDDFRLLRIPKPYRE